MTTDIILRRSIDRTVIDRAIMAGVNAIGRERIAAGETRIATWHPHARTISEPMMFLNVDAASVNGKGYALAKCDAGEPFAIFLDS